VEARQEQNGSPDFFVAIGASKSCLAHLLSQAHSSLADTAESVRGQHIHRAGVPIDEAVGVIAKRTASGTLKLGDNAAIDLIPDLKSFFFVLY
jgi:hypothetical protein